MNTVSNKLWSKTILAFVLVFLVFSPFSAMPAQAQSTSGSGSADTPACNLDSPGTYDLCITNIVYVFTVGVGSAFAYVAAYFFDLAIQISLNGTVYALTFVSTGWTTARDLANMAFLFILIYIAFQIMLRADTNGTQSLLAGVIVVALLVNFSFFATRLVIDAGNILAIEFYNAIQAPPISDSLSSTGTTAINTVNYLGGSSSIYATKDLTASIMNLLQVQNIFNTNSFSSFRSSNGFLVRLITLCFIYIAAAMIFWALTVTFVSVGIKFLMRVVILWFAIIFSPLAFIAYAIPKFRDYFDTWLKELMKAAFYPVAFMFIFLILVNFTNQMGNCTIQGNVNQGSCLLADIFASIPGGDVSNTPFLAVLGVALANIVVRLGFVLAVLYMGMKASEKFSLMGASGAQKVGNWFGTGVLKGYNVGYKRLGPGAWAGGVGRALQTGEVSASAFGKQLFRFQNATVAKLGNNFVGREARRYVTEPLSKTRVPGSAGESYIDMMARRDKEGKENEANVGAAMGNIKNRQDSRDLKKLDEQWTPLDKRVKELEAVLGPLVPKDAAELVTRKAELDKLRPRREQLISNMEKMGGPQIATLAGKDIEGIINHLTATQMKATKEDTRRSLAERAKLEKQWHENAKKAPLAESKDQIKKLGDIHAELTKIGANMGAIKQFNANIKPPPGTAVSINLGVAKSMKKELEDEIDKQEDIRDDRTLDDKVHPITGAKIGKAERTRAGQVVKNLKKAVEQIKKLEEQVKDIPKVVGGREPEGEFEHKGK